MAQGHFFSDHAKLRMRQMSVDPMKVYRILDNPEQTLPDPVPNRKRIVGEDLIIVLAPGRNVVSVLWRCTGDERPDYDRKDPSTWPRAKTNA